MGCKPGTGVRLVDLEGPIDHGECKYLLKVSRCPVDSLFGDK